MAEINDIRLSFLVDISANNPYVEISNNSVGDDLSLVEWRFDFFAPSGNVIKQGLITSPSDIVGLWSKHTISDNWGIIEWSGPPYSIVATAIDSAGNALSKTYNFSISRPNGNTSKCKDRFGLGSNDAKVSCQEGSVYFENKTNSIYKGLPGDMVSSNLKVVYPLDENDNQIEPFSINGFSNALVPVYNSGEGYKFVSTQVYDYNVSENVTIRIKYVQRDSFNVYCNIDLFPLVCAFDKMIDEYDGGGCSMGVKDTNKLNVINSKMALVLAGISQPLLGVDVPKLIKEIETIGGFDCDCCNTNIGGIKQKSSALIDGYNFSVTNEGGDIVGSFANSSGNNIVLTLRDKRYIFVVSPSSSQSIKIVPSETGFVKTFEVSLDPTTLGYDLAETIQANVDLYNKWRMLFGFGEATRIVVDGRCIFNTTSTCSYDFTLSGIPASGTFAILSSITTNGITRNLNYFFNLSNLPQLQSSLNTLGLGVWIVSDMGGGTVGITSIDNSSNIGGITYRLGSTNHVAGMERVCGGYTDISLDSFAAEIVNYLCDLTIDKIGLNNSYTIKYVDVNGVLRELVVERDSNLAELISELISRYGETSDYVNSLGAVNCTSLKKVFPVNNNPITNFDYIFGVKSGDCSRINPLDLFNKQIEMAKSDLDSVYNFCELMQKCGAGQICEPFDYFEIIESEFDETCVEPVGITYTITE